MNNFFAQLRPMERRLAVGVLVIFILVLNWLFIWPHFSDLGKLRDRIRIADGKLKEWQAVIADKPKYDNLVKKYENAGAFVAPEDQAINFMQTVYAQAAGSRVSVGNYGRSSAHESQFFTELSQGPVTVVATDAQLVDFLYKLGSGASMARVRDLELQPDVPHQHLNANIQFVASYQNKPAPAAPAGKTAPAPPAPAAKTIPKTNSKPANVKSK